MLPPKYVLNLPASLSLHILWSLVQATTISCTSIGLSLTFLLRQTHPKKSFSALQCTHS